MFWRHRAGWFFNKLLILLGHKVTGLLDGHQERYSESLQ